MKGVIVEVDLYYKIRTLHEDGESIRAISRRLAVSRLAVKKYCQGNTHPDVRKRITGNLMSLLMMSETFLLIVLMKTMSRS